MAEFARRTEEDDTHSHLVKWRGSAWDLVARAADVLGARHHKKYAAADIIRDGTLKYVYEILGTTDEPGSAA